MKFLHLADIHLDMPFKLVGAMGEKRRMMQLDILRQVAEYVNKNKINFINLPYSCKDFSNLPKRPF